MYTERKRKEMKSKYQKPSVDVIRFETENILDGSGIELPDHDWSTKRVNQSINNDSEATKSLGRIEQ